MNFEDFTGFRIGDLVDFAASAASLTTILVACAALFGLTAYAVHRMTRHRRLRSQGTGTPAAPANGGASIPRPNEPPSSARRDDAS